jgi:hypothetical protein
MGKVIRLFGSRTRECSSVEPKQPAATPAPAPTPRGKVVGACDLCRQPVEQEDAFFGEGRVIHFSCLIRQNKERGWDACRHFMFHTLAFPFARALGTPRVRPLIDQFLDDATHYALAFTLFNHLERMLRESAAAPSDRAEAERALAECKQQLRRYLQPLPR